MKELNETAKRARDLRAEEHRHELNMLEAEVASKNRQIQSLFDQGVASASAVRKISRHFHLALGALACMTGIALREHFSDDFEKDRPPALQKIEVVTYGFIDAKGIYREYEDGEPLNPQPLGWMP